MLTYHLISLGCAKNLVDSEVMLGSLSQGGMELCATAEEAQILIVNTCGFIQPAVEEAIEEIVGLIDLKKEDSSKKIVVVGCLVQRYQEKLLAELPEVDLFIGTEGPAQIAQTILQLDNDNSENRIWLPDRYLMDSTTPRILSTSHFMAWLKITEGCSNHCSYCMIPSIRGPLRSRSVVDLVAEAVKHDAEGVRELCLVAQDSTAYGNDFANSSENLVTLLQQLLLNTSIPWIRVLYLYPTGIDNELLTLMAENPRIVPYLDIPMQHVNNTILQAMNRDYSETDLDLLLENTRRIVPDIAIRTTFLVGFPGETEKDILQLEKFMKRARLDHVGIFHYANEEGCPAEHFLDQVPEEEKVSRRNYLLDLQKTIASENMKKYIGRVEPVLIEGVCKETDLLLEGRTRYQAPEVDGCVYINEGTARPGEILNVQITESEVYDLVGGIVSV